MENIKEKIERLKAKGELFLEKGLRVFIKKYSGDFYFCDILSIDENSIIVYNFAGKRKGEKDGLLWLDIDDLDEYKERGEEG